MCKKKQNKQKQKTRVSRHRLSHTRTSLHMQNQACVHEQDYVYTGSYPETLKTQKRAKSQNRNSNNLTCI